MDRLTSWLCFWNEWGLWEWVEYLACVPIGVVFIKVLLDRALEIPRNLKQVAATLGGTYTRVFGSKPVVVGTYAGARVVIDFLDRAETRDTNPAIWVRIRREVPTAATVTLKPGWEDASLAALGVPETDLYNCGTLDTTMDELFRSGIEQAEFTVGYNFAELRVRDDWDPVLITTRHILRLVEQNALLAEATLAALARPRAFAPCVAA
jgi:hypothetical protein